MKTACFLGDAGLPARVREAWLSGLARLATSLAPEVFGTGLSGHFEGFSDRFLDRFSVVSRRFESNFESKSI